MELILSSWLDSHPNFQARCRLGPKDLHICVDMLFFAVSRWDKDIMLELTQLHGIPVNTSCVNVGFDWRSGQLNPVLAECFGKGHVRDRDAVLAQRSMLSYYAARRIRPSEVIPTKQSDHNHNQKILEHHDSDSVPTDPHHHHLSLMSPEEIQSIYIERNQSGRERILHFLELVPDASMQGTVVPIPMHESVDLTLVDRISVESRPQRGAALKSFFRNAEMFQGQQELNKLEFEDSSDGDDKQDWGARGEKPSDEDEHSSDDDEN